MTDARTAILARIRSALDDRGKPPVPSFHTPDAAPSGDTPPAPARDTPPAPARDTAALFAERVADYHARVHAGDDVRALVTAACARHDVRRLGVPTGVPTSWLPDGIELSAITADPDIAELDAVDGVLTSCAVAIAETGTIVLDAGEGQGPRAVTLLPDLHICVVQADRIVADVPAAIALLARDPARPTTFISGPSATSDIELDRVEGVHGPRRLEVIVTDT